MFNIFIFRLRLFVVFLIITTFNIFMLSVVLPVVMFFSSLSTIIKLTEYFKEGFYYIFEPYFKYCKTCWKSFITPPFNK